MEKRVCIYIYRKTIEGEKKSDTKFETYLFKTALKSSTSILLII